MKLLSKTAVLLAAVLVFAHCTVLPRTAAENGTITVTVPEGAELMVRVKTADGTMVKVQGADQMFIPGTDEVRELKEDKPMQILKAAGREIVFTGAIREFDIKDNRRVESIDTLLCPELEVLYCAGNSITQLQLSANKALKRLQCYNNRLTALDVSMQPHLELLWCGINQLAALDVSKCEKLTQLRCYLNAIGQEPMDALLYSLPPVQKEHTTAVHEARILASGDAVKNSKPSAAALEQAWQKGWTILDSADTPVEP